MLFDFLLFEKINQSNYIKFKDTWNVNCGVWRVSSSHVQLWCNRLKEDVNDNAHPGHPSTSAADKNIEAVKKMFLENRLIAIREVADDVCISFDSCQAIFTDVLGMKCAATNIVPKLLNWEQTQRRMDIAREMLTTFNDNKDLLKKVITADELFQMSLYI